MFQCTDSRSVTIADVNGDGKPDLTVANYGSSDVSVALGNGDGTFETPYTLSAGTRPIGVAAGDFNGDANVDLAVANYGSTDVSVLLGNGDGTFRPTQAFGTGTRPLALAAGDFDGDGTIDLAVLSGAVLVWLGNGDGTFRASLTFGAGYGPRSVAVGDFNRDGRLDLAVANSSGEIAVLINNTPAMLPPPDTTPPTPIEENSTAVSDCGSGERSDSPGAVGWAAAPAASAPWPNEPAGWGQVNDQSWDALTGSGWSWLRRASSQDPSIVADATAPLSPQNVLQMVFTPDMGYGNEPSVHWIRLPWVEEIYTGWWIKLSPNWTCSLGEWCTHVTYLFAHDGVGQVYTAYYHPSEDQAGPPYRIGANTEWAPYATHPWYPNVTTTWVYPGDWHRIEFYYKWETTPGVSGDGIIRWWVDGVLNGAYTDVHYPSERGLQEFQLAPTFGTPPAEQYLFVDHTHVSFP